MIEINNNVKIADIYNNKTWIHGKSNENIDITIFLITICSDQLKYSLESINNLNTNHNVYVNVIMNVSPTNKAYNEMRLRCKTKYFIQNDEDMELYNNAIDIFYNTLVNNSNKIFLNTYKLIDTSLGIGDPPIIDCLKLYNNDIMKKYPTFSNGSETISSVDSLWHKNIDEIYKVNNTNKIIGYHGKHRSNFDLMLRHCKILSSIIDNRIKTNNGHLCKIIRCLFSENNDLMDYFHICIQHFRLFVEIDVNKINNIIKILNSYIPNSYIEMYNIKNRFNIEQIDNNKFNYKYFILLFDKSFNFNFEKFYAVFSIFCIATNNYQYSFDKYPYELYNYFDNIIKNKKLEIVFLDNDNFNNKRNKIYIVNKSNKKEFSNVKYDKKLNRYYIL